MSTTSAAIDNLVKEDRVWMEEFFQDFFLDGPPIYTLFGSKPISEINLTYATEEECKTSALLYADSQHMQGEEREWFLQAAAEHYKADHSAENWEKWVRFFRNVPKSPFLFGKRTTRSKHVWAGCIVNVQETIWTLQEHHDLFSKRLGRDFDPVAVTMDFPNANSDFWESVFYNHLLRGIILGYGYKNAYFFDLMMKRPDALREEDPLFSTIAKEHPKNRLHKSIDNLPLPYFRSFGLPFSDDPIAEKYKIERKNIQSKINAGNFFSSVVLQLLGKYSLSECQDQ